jgi:hypothetical protein
MKPKNRTEQIIIESIRRNADLIQKSEGKGCSEADYLSICALLDDLRSRVRGDEGRRLLMVIVARD